MRTRLLRRASIGALALTLIGGTAALADDVANNLDVTVDPAAETMSLTAGGSVGSTTLRIVERNSDGKNGCNLQGTSELITASVSSSSPLVASVSPSSVTFDSCSDTQTLTVTPLKGGQTSITLTETSNNSGAIFNLAPATFTVNVTSPNTAPSKPGAPLTSDYTTRGDFTLTWPGSSDTQDDSFTYSLEGKRANETEFSPVASGLPAASHTFTGGAPAEGTWTYRVKAVETGTSPALSSDWSDLSLPVVVDRAAPNAPTAEADRPAEYSDGTTAWWMDSVTVSFTGAGDPTLPDTSAGSGVDSVTADQSITASGPFSASGTSTDRAGNESVPTSFVGSIDSTDPTVTCPASSVVLGTSGATIPWEATDSGDSSGLVASEGTIAVDANTVGAARTVTIPEGTAEDNVGNNSPATTCTYQVRYAWEAFLQPINDTAHDQIAMSVFKAGSTVPVKFQLKDASAVVVAATVAPAWAGAKTASSCSLAGGDPEAVATVSATAGTAFRWDATSQQYIYNWSTKGLPANTCWEIGVTLDDGLTHTVIIGLKK